MNPPSMPAPPQYRPLRPVSTISLVAVAALALTVVFSALEMISAGHWLSVSRRLHGDLANLSGADADLIDGLDTVMAVGGAFAWLVAAVTFVVWLFRVRANVEIFDRYIQNWSRPWLFFGWIVPFGNLVIPRRIVIDIWIGSHPGDQKARQEESTQLINYWWGFFLFSWFTGRAVARLDPITTGGLDMQACLRIIDGAVTITAALLAAVIVLGISRGLEGQADGRQG